MSESEDDIKHPNKLHIKKFCTGLPARIKSSILLQCYIMYIQPHAECKLQAFTQMLLPIFKYMSTYSIAIPIY